MPSLPNDKEDLKKFAEEIFGNKDKPDSQSNNSLTLSALSRVQEDNRRIRTREEMSKEYRRLAWRTYKKSVYTNPIDLIRDIRHGKIFIFRVTVLRWILWISLLVSPGVFYILDFTLDQITGIFAVLYPISMLFFAPLGIIGVFLNGRDYLVVGPLGFVCGKIVLLWEDISNIDSLVFSERTQNGKHPVGWLLKFYLRDRSTFFITLRYRSNECPVMNSHEFIFQVVNLMFNRYRLKNPQE